MSFSRRIVRVFIASPGDLGPERHVARDVALEINQLLGDFLGIQVEMVGWEETIGSIGRPQELINKDLKRCELFIGIIWKRWGTPPDVTGTYTSGFEEEFYLAKELHSKYEKPQISMFFKNVSEDLMRDPGADLQKVIKFKAGLVEKKEILFMTFNDEKDFEKKLRKILTSYVTELHDKEVNDEDFNINQSQGDVIVHTEDAVPVGSDYFSENTIDFLKKMTSGIESQGVNDVTSHQIAFFRLLSLILKKPGNSDVFLEAHDANLIYLNVGEYKLGKNERSGLIISGLNNFSDHNIPLWKWLDLDKGTSDLELYSFILGDKSKANAISAMSVLNQPMSNVFSRDSIIRNWLSDDSSKSVKVAALNYLSAFGVNDDLPIIESEISKNDTATNDLAIETIISIVLLDSVDDAFELVLKYQPRNLSENIVDKFRKNSFYISLSNLKKALLISCPSIRDLAFELISDEHSIDEEIFDAVLKSDFMDIKIKLLVFMSEDEYVNAKPLAKTWLIYKDSNGKFNNDNYKKFEKETLHHESRNYLEKLLEEEFKLDGTPLLALAKNGYGNYTYEVKEAIKDGCERLFNDIKIKYSNKSSDDLENVFNQIEQGVKREICLSYVDWISSKLDKKDVNLIRGYLKSNNANITMNIIKYFSRFGEWCDVSLLMKFTNDLSWSYVNASPQPKKIKDIFSETLIKLSVDKISDLLSMDIEPDLKKSILAKISKVAIQKMDIDYVITILDDPNPFVREAMCIKYMNSVSKEKLFQLMSIILSRETYFYNVVHWLDMGLSLKKEWSQNATSRLLKLY